MSDETTYTVICNGTYNIHCRKVAIMSAVEVCRIYPGVPVFVYWTNGGARGYLNPHRAGETVIFSNETTPLNWQELGNTDGCCDVYSGN